MKLTQWGSCQGAYADVKADPTAVIPPTHQAAILAQCVRLGMSRHSASLGEPAAQSPEKALLLEAQPPQRQGPGAASQAGAGAWDPRSTSAIRLL